MPSARNPSHFYTVEQIDGIVDRLLKGRGIKPQLRVDPVVAWKTGLLDLQTIREYVVQRWGSSRQGVTQRSNNLSGKLHSARHGSLYQGAPAFNAKAQDFAVWRVSTYYSTLCHITGPGGTEAQLTMLRQQAFLLWGWMIEGLKSADGLEFRLVGMGGPAEAAILNASLIDDMKSRRGAIVKEIERYQVRLKEIDVRIEGTMALSLEASLAG